jgi:hypothetical protein
MEAVLVFGILAFLAGMAIRSLFSSRQPPIIYVQAESVERNGSCLTIIVLGMIFLIVLLVAAAV